MRYAKRYDLQHDLNGVDIYIYDMDRDVVINEDEPVKDINDAMQFIEEYEDDQAEKAWYRSLDIQE
jgi:hypothetical protein